MSGEHPVYQQIGSTIGLHRMVKTIRSHAVTGINKYSEIGNVSAVKMESVIQ